MQTQAKDRSCAVWEQQRSQQQKALTQSAPRARLMVDPEWLILTFCCAIVSDTWLSAVFPSFKKLFSGTVWPRKNSFFLLLPQNQSSISEALRAARHSGNQPPARGAARSKWHAFRFLS